MVDFASLTSAQLDEMIRGKPLTLLPIGQIEEHGPHLPLNTDLVIAEGVTAAAAQALDEVDCLVLPGVWAGYSGRELAHWPGTIRLRTRVFADMVADIVRSLIAMGLKKIITVNGHGHHPALLQMVAREIADETGVYIACADVAKLAARAVAKHRKSEPGGCIHGGEFETSLMLYLGQEVDMTAAHREDFFRYASANVPGDGFAGGKSVFWSTWGIQRSETGLYGDPTVASAETGKLIFRETVEALTRFCREFYGAVPANWAE